jgi:hypothetical protein
MFHHCLWKCDLSAFVRGEDESFRHINTIGRPALVNQALTPRRSAQFSMEPENTQ